VDTFPANNLLSRNAPRQTEIPEFAPNSKRVLRALEQCLETGNCIRRAGCLRKNLRMTKIRTLHVDRWVGLHGAWDGPDVRWGGCGASRCRAQTLYRWLQAGITSSGGAYFRNGYPHASSPLNWWVLGGSAAGDTSSDVCMSQRWQGHAMRCVALHRDTGEVGIGARARYPPPRHGVLDDLRNEFGRPNTAFSAWNQILSRQTANTVWDGGRSTTQWSSTMHDIHIGFSFLQ
jgi:hypothetical protein